MLRLALRRRDVGNVGRAKAMCEGATCEGATCVRATCKQPIARATSCEDVRPGHPSTPAPLHRSTPCTLFVPSISLTFVPFAYKKMGGGAGVAPPTLTTPPQESSSIYLEDKPHADGIGFTWQAVSFSHNWT